MFDPLYVLSGAVVGLLVGMTGVGGGSLMTPLLVLAFGFHPVAAVGTDLLFAAGTKSVGTLVHGANRNVSWRVTGLLAVGSLPSSLLMILLLDRLGNPNALTAKIISVTLGIALLLTAVSLVFRPQIIAFAARFRGNPHPRRTTVLTIITGAVLGVLVSLSSVGAGAIGMTALLMLYPALPVAVLVASDIAHAVPLTLVAGLGHWYLGSINWPVLTALLIGSMPGIVVGSLASTRVPETALRGVLAAVLFVVGARLVV
ncbi:MAG TPA: sulfite exporter TauE/SafE family protein [Acidisphaera sp.]|nr:sulfite exporter TauE/SafE family protein [Acidisphaera sp.]